MKQNRDCKIVQDLLPTYIESLTNEVTNEFIEEHIARCPECAQVLKDMNGDLQLEKINQDYDEMGKFYLDYWSYNCSYCFWRGYVYK